jgi:hypothetical protein
MSDDLRSLVNAHHAFYEISPYNLILDEKPGSVPAMTRTIHAGFDVDIFGATPNNKFVTPGPDYALAYAELHKIIQNIGTHAGDSCSLELLSFPSRIVFVGRGHTEPQGMLRIRISHHRGIGLPSGLPEEQVLKEVEKQLKQLGMARQ